MIKANIHEQAQPFYLKGGKRVVVLFIHGFTASPSELYPVAKLLHEYYDCSTSGLLLPGHGSRPEDLNLCSWQDWFAAVKKELSDLQREYAEVFVAGLSMGGLLALYSGLHVPGISGVSAINTPVFQRSSITAALAPLLRIFRPYWPKQEPTAQQQLEAEGRFAYNFYPLKAFQSMGRLRRRVLQELGDMEIPVLIMQSQNDEVVKPESGGFLAARLRHRGGRLVELESSGHIASMGPEKEKIARELAEFIKNRSVSRHNTADSSGLL